MRNGCVSDGLKRGYSFMSSANTSEIDGRSSGMMSTRSKRNNQAEKRGEGDEAQYEGLLTRRSYVGDLDTLKRKHIEVVTEAIAKEKLQQEARPQRGQSARSRSRRSSVSSSGARFSVIKGGSIPRPRASVKDVLGTKAPQQVGSRGNSREKGE